jgi:hypothetical protein
VHCAYLAGRGFSIASIAAALGRSVRSIQVTTTRWHIAPGAGEPVELELSPQDRAALAAAARQRGVDARVLGAALLHQVLAADLLAAVLSDPPLRSMRGARLAAAGGLRADGAIVRLVDDEPGIEDAPRPRRVPEHAACRDVSGSLAATAPGREAHHGRDESPAAPRVARRLPSYQLGSHEAIAAAAMMPAAAA